jgi:glutamyl-tRNA reductase
VAPTIVALRERAESVRAGELDRLRTRYDDLDPRQLDMVDAVTRGMVAKLLHQPTVVLKDAAGSPRGDRLVAALRDLFEIEP